MPSILLIEDTEAVRTLFRTILEGAGYVVREASQGREGVRAFQQAPTDLVITDIYMPDGDGLEVISQLRREFPTLKILAISGRTGQEALLPAAKLMGADAILLKPVSIPTLLTTIANLFDSASPVQLS